MLDPDAEIENSMLEYAAEEGVSVNEPMARTLRPRANVYPLRLTAKRS